MMDISTGLCVKSVCDDAKPLNRRLANLLAASPGGKKLQTPSIFWMLDYICVNWIGQNVILSTFWWKNDSNDGSSHELLVCFFSASNKCFWKCLYLLYILAQGIFLQRSFLVNSLFNKCVTMSKTLLAKYDLLPNECQASIKLLHSWCFMFHAIAEWT